MKIIIFVLYFISIMAGYISSIYLYSQIVQRKPVIKKSYIYLSILCFLLQALLQMKGLAIAAPLFTFGWLIIFGKNFFKLLGVKQ